MRLSAPTQVIFLITLIVAIFAVLATMGAGYVTIPVVTDNAFWFLTGAYVLLALGVTLKGL
ncbi:MAG: hypothetical protein LBQ18_02260 [Campylobacteraceae bacterium]|jgi:hypothetical protein|nr:hypothetical protein [Campylobacteraceae bacterium]